MNRPTWDIHTENEFGFPSIKNSFHNEALSVSMALKHWVKPGPPYKNKKPESPQLHQVWNDKHDWITHFKSYVTDEEMGEFTLW